MSENNSSTMQQNNAKGSTALQAQVVNVYPNGITEEKCREICMELYKTNILSLRDEAKDIACQRVERLTDMFIKKLSEQDENIRKKIEEQLKEPSMQEAIFKSQKCYAMSNDEDHLKILTDMLIDRGSISQRTNKQMLIDEAIDVLPRLNQKHLDILAFYLSISITHPFYNKQIIDTDILNLVNYLQRILPLGEDDSNLLYLAQKNCLIKYNTLEHLNELDVILGGHVELLHSGFPRKDYDTYVTVNIPEIPFAGSLIKPENVVINTSLEMLKEILSDKNLSKVDYDNIIQFWHRNKGENDSQLIKNYITDNFKYGNLLFENWNKIENYGISVLGITIAQVYFRTKYQYDINWDFA